MPPRRVLYNSCYGSFGYSRYFIECFGTFQSRHDPALLEAINDFGRANAKMFEKAFAAYVIYQKYDIDSMIHRANAMYLKEKNERDIASLLQKIALQEEFGTIEATYQDVRTSQQGLARFTQASLQRAKALLEAELALSLFENVGSEPPYFTESFYPAYRRYQESKRPAYYEPCSMLSSLLKDANSPKAWFAAPGYQAFGMAFLYENAEPTTAGRVYDPFSRSYIDAPESSYEGFGLLCASGESANLRFADVPALVDYYITSTDGLEQVRWDLPPLLQDLPQ